MPIPFNSIPGPRPLPLVGNVSAFSGPLEFMTEASRTYGGLWRFRIGPQHSLVITDPAVIEDVLVTQRKATIKDPITQGLSDVLGQGLLTAEGETWKQNRKLIAPSFQPRHLAELGDTMVESTEVLVGALPEGARDVHEDMMELTLDIAVRTLFGTVLDDASRVGPLVEELMHGFNQKTHTWRRLLPDWLPTRGKRMAMRNQQELHALLQQIVAQKRAAPDEGSDLLSRLLAARDDEGRGMDDEQLRDEMLTLFLAGHETTALALSYALWLLARHPQVQSQVRAELDAVIGDARPSARHTRQLPLLDAVFQESMRLYPPAWIVGRAANQDMLIGDAHVPQGTILLMPQWVVHRDARWYPEPEAFRPQRWLGESDRPKFAFFPFGGGSRVCVGNHFARMEALLVLASWLQAFELESVQDEMGLMPSVTLRPTDGVRVGLRARSGRTPDRLDQGLRATG